MIFEISRTSIWDDKTQPHDLAFKKAVPVYDSRTCTEEEHDSQVRLRTGSDGFSMPWREYGTEHTTDERGHIKRRLPDAERWVVEIGSLEDLVRFAGKFDIIVSGGDEPSIEIYDDYRE